MKVIDVEFELPLSQDSSDRVDLPAELGLSSPPKKTGILFKARNKIRSIGKKTITTRLVRLFNPWKI